MGRKGDSIWLLRAILFFVLMRVIYEVLGVLFAIISMETRVIIAGLAAFYIYFKIEDKVIMKLI